MGNIIAIPVTGLLSKYGFDGGWPSVFYFFGESGGIYLPNIFLSNKVFVIYYKKLSFLSDEAFVQFKVSFLPQKNYKVTKSKSEIKVHY